jgi:glycosyltransferase involved in cell wall biosynthesis
VLTVGVVIPTYNSAASVATAVASVLGQEPAAAHIVVVDDGSTDATDRVLAGYAGRIDYVRQPNRGPSAARNAGLARLATDTVVFLDADDLLLPGALRTRCELLASPDAVWAHTDGWLEEATGRRRRFSEIYPPVGGAAGGWIFAGLLTRNFITMDGVIARRAVVIEVGGFDEAIRGTEDWDLWLRLAVRHPVAHSPQTTFVYRRSPNTLSGDRGRMDRMRYQILAKAYCLFPGEVRAAGPTARRSVADAHNALAAALATEGRWGEARPHLASSLRLWPLQRRAWLLFLRCRALARARG